ISTAPGCCGNRTGSRRSHASLLSHRSQRPYSFQHGELNKGFAMRRSVRTVGLLVLLAAVLTAGAPSVIRIHHGDTLSGLAAKYGTTVTALQRANHLTGTTIYTGELLRIPGQNVTATPTRTTDVVYVVRPGDNLTRLGRSLGHSVAWLIARNH